MSSEKLPTLIATVQDIAKDSSSFKWEVEKLYAVREWALEQQPVKVGDHVRIRETVCFDKPQHSNGSTNGWYPYRDALAIGATAVVKDVAFSPHHKGWYADVVLDSEWGVSLDGKRRWDHSENEKGTFMIRVGALERVENPTSDVCSSCKRVS